METIAGEWIMKGCSRSDPGCLHSPEDLLALIRKIGLKKPDPDTGKTYDRLLVSPGRAIQLLGWGDVGAAQILKAQNTTAQKYGIRYSDKPDKWT